MAQSTLPDAVTGQNDTSVILNTFMYINQCPDSSGNPTFTEVMNAIDRSSLAPDEAAAYDSVMQYLDSHPNSEVANLHLHSYSDNMGSEYTGAIGAAFYSENSSGIDEVYVTYRGTGDGRWYDNGDALGCVQSPYQMAANDYFDYVMDDLHATGDMDIYVTGHSKGGNNAQYVTLFSENSYLIDQCISYDGEGFSPEAIQHLIEIYGEDEFRRRCEKMYGINGDNDFVNVLGIPVIPEDHKVYVMTDTDVYDPMGAHDIRYMYDYEAGSLHQTTDLQRELALLSQSISQSVMTLPADQRQDICRTVMTVAEYFMNGTDNYLVGLNGEHCTLEEALTTLMYTDEILDHVYTPEGQRFLVRTLNDVLHEKFGYGRNEDAPFIVDVICTVSALYLTGRIDILLSYVQRIKKALDAAVAVYQGAVKVAEFVGVFLEHLGEACRYLLDRGYRAAVQYCNSHNEIRLHTDDLRSLAARLQCVNQRLSALDDRMDSLYRCAKLTDLGALIYAGSADLRICWSKRLDKCAEYLIFTAEQFEAAESNIAGMFS